MPAVWDESNWAVFGALLRADGFSQEEVVQYVNCSDRSVNQANRVRRQGDRDIWVAVVAREVTVADAADLVRRFEDNRVEQKIALQRLRDGEIANLRHHQANAPRSATAFEKMKRKLEAAPTVDWSLTPEQVAEGIGLAEAGLAEDAETWPGY